MADPFQQNLTTLAKRLRPLILGGAADFPFSFNLNRIWVIHRADSDAESFPKTTAGLTAALLVTDSDDIIWMPPCSISLDFTLPAGAGMASMGDDAIIVGTVTLGGENSYMQSMVIAPEASSGSPVVGVIGPPNATAIINNCLIVAVNNGAGDAYGWQQADEAGWIKVFGCDVEAHALGGGSGYGGYLTAGQADVDGGKCYGTTARYGIG